MSQSDMALRIRTESSYQFSLASSRSSKFPSGQSLIFENDSAQIGFHELVNSRLRKENVNSSLEYLFESRTKYINSKTQYIVVNDYDTSRESVNDKKASYNANERKKQFTTTIPSYPQHLSTTQRPILLPTSTVNLLSSYRRCPLNPSSELLNRAYGAMFGFVIGDSIGSYMVHQSFTSINEIAMALEMKGGGRFGLCEGQGTDETEMAIVLSEGLIESRQIGKLYDGNIIAGKYYEWIESKPFDFPTLVAISFSQIRRQRILSQGEIDSESLAGALINSSSRNVNHQSSLSLIRVIPIVLYTINLGQQRLIGLIKEETRFFTPNEFSVEVAIVYGLLLRFVMLDNDNEYAFHQTSQWVYVNGSQKLLQLWNLVQRGIEIAIHPMNMNHVSVPFLFAMKEINKKEINFVDVLVKTLLKGYNTDTNCSIVMGLVGAVIGFNRIPNYLKNKVIDCRVQKSPRHRDKVYCSSKIVELVPKLMQCNLK